MSGSWILVALRFLPNPASQTADLAGSGVTSVSPKPTWSGWAATGGAKLIRTLSRNIRRFMAYSTHLLDVVRRLRVRLTLRRALAHVPHALPRDRHRVRRVIEHLHRYPAGVLCLLQS